MLVSAELGTVLDRAVRERLVYHTVAEHLSVVSEVLRGRLREEDRAMVRKLLDTYALCLYYLFAEAGKALEKNERDKYIEKLKLTEDLLKRVNTIAPSKTKLRTLEEELRRVLFRIGEAGGGVRSS